MKNKVKPGQIQICPVDNRLMEMPPYVNDYLTMPRWFKSIDKNDPGSLRKCAGVNEYLTTGITLPAWTNMHFKPNHQTQTWESRLDDYSTSGGEISRVQGFGYSSTGQCPVTAMRKLEEGYQYPKIVVPFRFKTAPGWSTLLMPLIWEPNPDYQVIGAVINTDYYHMINCVLNITTNTDFKIPYGTPLMHLIPFKRSGDFKEIIFDDQSNWKYYDGGFGFGHIKPSFKAAGPYRQGRKQADDLAEQIENSGKIKKIINYFNKGKQ